MMDKPLWFIVIESLFGIFGIVLNILIVLVHAWISKKSIPDWFMIYMSVCNLCICCPVLILSIYSLASDDVIILRDRIFESIKAGDNIGYGMGLLVMSITRYLKTFHPKMINQYRENFKRTIIASGFLALITFSVHVSVFMLASANDSMVIIQFSIVLIVTIFVSSIYIAIYSQLSRALVQWEIMRRSGDSALERNKERENSPRGYCNNTVHPISESSSQGSQPENNHNRKDSAMKQETSTQFSGEVTCDDRMTNNTGLVSDRSRNYDERRFYLSNCKKSVKATKIFFAITASWITGQIFYWTVYFLTVGHGSNITRVSDVVMLLLDIRIILCSVYPIVYISMNSVYRKRLTDIITRK